MQCIRKIRIFAKVNRKSDTGTNDTWALQSFYHPITCLTVLIDYNNKFGGKDTILHLCHLLLALQAF